MLKHSKIKISIPDPDPIPDLDPDPESDPELRSGSIPDPLCDQNSNFSSATIFTLVQKIFFPYQKTWKNFQSKIFFMTLIRRSVRKSYLKNNRSWILIQNCMLIICSNYFY